MEGRKCGKIGTLEDYMKKDELSKRSDVIFVLSLAITIILVLGLLLGFHYALNAGYTTGTGMIVIYVLGICGMFTLLFCMYKLFQKRTKNILDVEANLESMKEELENSRAGLAKAEHDNAAKTALLNSMAVQVRTPLSTILGMDELLQEREEDQEHLEYIETIYSAGKIIESLLSDLSDLAKIEQGNLYIEEAAYSIAEVIRETYTLTKVSAIAKSIDLQLELDEEMPSILRGDAKRMKQVILNLLANAVTYTPIGQVVYHVGFEREDEKNILLKVSVRDTGIGIKKEDMEKAFGKLDNPIDPVDRVLEGVGLGLTVTNQILQQMDSSLQVESEYGQGSVFGFTVRQEVIGEEPIGKKEIVIQPTTRPKREMVKSFVAPSARILAVDDNRMNLAVMNGILKRTKVQIDCVNSGKECLEAVAKERYNLIFLDLLMPEMDGEQTLQAMRRMENNLSQDAPVIAITASEAKGVRDFYIKQGFTDYITKPIEMATIYQLLKDYLPEEMIMNPDSSRQQIVTDVIQIQENIVKEYTSADVLGAVEGIKKAMIDFDIEKATAALNRLGVSEVPEKFREDIKDAIACMGKEDFEKVAWYLDKMSKDAEG